VVISSLPLFYLSFFKASKSICKKITEIQRKFLWSWSFEERKIAWIKWKDLYKPKGEGGLGIRDTTHFNKASLAK